MIAAVDPGHKFGAIAWLRSQNPKTHENVPKVVSTGDIRAQNSSYYSVFRTLKPKVIAIEKIPHLDSPGCFQLAMSYGAVCEAAEASAAEILMVEPQVWQHHFKIDPWLKYDERKRFCQGLAKEIFGVPKVRLHDADALLILKWALDTVKAAKQ